MLARTKPSAVRILGQPDQPMLLGTMDRAQGWEVHFCLLLSLIDAQTGFCGRLQELRELNASSQVILRHTPAAKSDVRV